MSENIFKPAGLSETMYFVPGHRSEGMSHGYRKAQTGEKPLRVRSDDGKWDEYDYGEVPFFLTKADRGAYTCARDFMKWKKALYDGKIISDSSVCAMRKPYIATSIPYVSFGLGNAVRLAPGYPVKTYHLNSNGGYSIVEGSWPEKDLHYVVFSNRNDWNQRHVTAAIDSIFKEKGYLD